MLYATRWFLTLFTVVLPFEIVKRIIDILLSEKDKIIYRISLTIIKYNEKEILKAKEFEKIIVILNDFSEKKWYDEDKFIQTIFEIKLSTDDINVNYFKASNYLSFIDLRKKIYH